MEQEPSQGDYATSEADTQSMNRKPCGKQDTLQIFWSYSFPNAFPSFSIR
jgi:hypothetical protein